MKGLLYKEWATLISSYKQSVFFIAFLYGGCCFAKKLKRL